jgi:S1-C subfamily serine protease
MFCGLCSTLIVSVLVLWQLFSISYGKPEDLNEPSEIFHKYHTAVITVVTDVKRGTGFCIDPQEYSSTDTGKKIKFVITAFHVVKGASKIDLYLYQNEKDSNGNWKADVCKADVSGLDIVRDVAFLSIKCDVCNCTRLSALQTRLSAVNDGETIFVIGDSSNRRFHSFIDGRVSSTNFTFSLASMFYEQFRKDITATISVSKVHALTGRVYLGDSGSAVMDRSGNVIGMISATSGDVNYCVTMEEISKACDQILDTLIPRYVSCTAHESVFLGRTYWGGKSGRSINEMNALATAMGVQYFAVAHDGLEAHAFTFHFLWWEILPGDDKIEDRSQCRCETNSFTDGQFLEATGKVMCGCSDNACWSNPLYEKRLGVHNDRRWAIYKTMNKTPEKNIDHVPSKKSLASMEDIAGQIVYWKRQVGTLTTEKEKLKSSLIENARDIAGQIVYWKRQVDILTTEKEKLKSSLNDNARVNYYWKQKADNLIIENEELVSEYRSHIAIAIAVIICVAASLVSLTIALHNYYRNTLRMLQEENIVMRGRLNEQLSQQNVLQNSDTTSLLTLE